MAQSNKTLITFTAGEWGKRLHGRTDLANADAAGRLVRNMVVAQYGRVKRRIGLDYIGAALGECFPGDPRFEIPSWTGLDEEGLITPVDVYGAQGPEELRSSPVPGPIWQVCKNVAYCWGPTEQGVTMQSIADRYRTRWVAKIEDDFIYYRRVGTGEAWRSVPNDLVAQPNETFNGLGFCFDANALPAFASQIGANIFIWRYQAGVPTQETFPGAGPRLFFDGTIQRDSGLWDIVCYFCWNGDLVAAFQREAFNANHTLFTSEDYYFTRVNLIEIGDEERLYIAASGQSSLYGLFRTAPFPPWPVFAHEEGLAPAYGVDGVEYDLIIKELGTYTEPGLAPAYGIDSIEYTPLTVDIAGGTEAGAAPAYGVESIEYALTTVAAGTYSEAGAAHAYGVELLAYDLISVNAGTYAEAGSAPAYGVESITYE